MYDRNQPSGLDELKKRLKDGNTGGAVLLWGAEEYTKDHYAERLRKLAKSAPLPDFNYQVFDFETQSPGDLEEATFALPYLWEKRVIELRGLPPAKKSRSLPEEEGEAYAQVLSSLPEYLTVLLVLRSGEKEKAKEKNMEGFRKIVEAFEEHGLSVEFAPASNAQLCSWVAKHFASRGVKTDPRLPQALISYCGSDMYTLQGEIEKLCSYAKYEQRALTEQDLHTCCCVNEKNVFFDVADCMNRRDIAGARRILTSLRMKDDAIMMAIGFLASNYRLMLLAQAGRNSGKTAAQIASEQRAPVWQVNRALSSLSHAEPGLVRYALAAIAEADRTMKTRRSNAKAVLELLVYRICTYGRTAG